MSSLQFSAVITRHGLLSVCLVLACSPMVDAKGKSFVGTYVNIHHLCEAGDSIAVREQALRNHLDRVKASGIDVVMPYATTTSGSALYPSEILPNHVYSDWDPLRLIVKEASVRGLRVYPVPCVLACGRDKPTGILAKHPEWALCCPGGRPIGHISPGHPDARAWVVSVMKEIVTRYRPDGLLLDYMRFNNRPMRLDPHSVALLEKRHRLKYSKLSPDQIQEFKEVELTRLMSRISREVRRIQPGIPVAIYSWGPHVVEGHRVAQDWRTWASKGYIDMVNISGYCYRKNYGDRYLKVFEKRLRGAVEINKALGSPVEITFCLGIRTSHGHITRAQEVADYLKVAKRVEVNGVSMFTWSYLQPFLPMIEERRYLQEFRRSRPR